MAVKITKHSKPNTTMINSVQEITFHNVVRCDNQEEYDKVLSLIKIVGEDVVWLSEQETTVFPKHFFRSTIESEAISDCSSTLDMSSTDVTPASHIIKLASK